MAYLVIAIGGLMSAIGIFAIASGFPVIEVERGWAEVISGSTMLAAGLLMVAAGLVLRTLIAIQRTLATRPAADFADAATSLAAVTTPEAEAPALEPHAGFAPELTEASPPALPIAAEPLAELMAHARDEVMAHAREEVSEPHAIFEPPAATVAAYHPAENLRARPEAIAADHATPTGEAHLEPEPRSDEIAPRDDAAPPHVARDGYELQTPSTPDHDLAPIATAPNEDWLDRAFSALDEELSGGARPTEPAAPVTAPEAAPPQATAHPQPLGETLMAEPAVAAEPPVAPPHPEAQVAPTEAAVIGRYESEGTSYIMYADGSIEAQSEAGIYRFRSMAELKAFIEG